MKNNKNDFKSYLLLLLIFLMFVLVPHFYIRHYDGETKRVFFERLNEDHEICRERFKEDNISPAICNEIRDSAKLAFDTASEKDFTLLLLFNAFLIGVGVGIWSIKNRMNEFEEKIKKMDS